MDYDDALRRIRDHGNLLFAPCSAQECEMLFAEAERRGHIRRNRWSDQLELTEHGESRLRRQQSQRFR